MGKTTQYMWLIELCSTKTNSVSTPVYYAGAMQDGIPDTTFFPNKAACFMDKTQAEHVLGKIIPHLWGQWKVVQHGFEVQP